MPVGLSSSPMKGVYQAACELDPLDFALTEF
jgi:hypothetical protein